MVSKSLPYLLQITKSKVPPILIGIGISIFHVLLTILVFEFDGILISLSNLEVTAYFTFTFGYVVYITRVIHNSHTNSFIKLLDNHNFTIDEKDSWKNEFFSYRNTWPETLIAILVGGIIAYNYLSEALLNEQGIDVYYYWRGLLIILIWILITQSTSLFVRNTTIMNKLSKEIEIDLINIDKLMPLTKAGVTSTLAFIGAYSFLFINGVDITQIDNPALLVLVPSIIVLLITPLKGIRKRVIKAKEIEIALIDRAIDGDMKALKASRLKNNLDNLNAIDLINYKKTIESQIEIPLNIPTASRFIFYLIIPFLTWVSASVVDKVIDYLIS